MHYSAALSVFKSTSTTYLFNQHFPLWICNKKFLNPDCMFSLFISLSCCLLLRVSTIKTWTICETHCSTWEADKEQGKYSAAERSTLASSIRVSTDEQTPDLLSGWSLVQWKRCDLTSTEAQEQLIKESRGLVLLFLWLRDLIPNQPLQHLQREGLAWAFEGILLICVSRPNRQSQRQGNNWGAFFF